MTPTIYDGVIEISSDSGEESTIQVLPKNCRPVKNTSTSEARAVTYKSDIVSFVDKDVDDVQTTPLPMKKSRTRGQRATDTLTAPSEQNKTSTRKLPRKQKLSSQQVELDRYARDLFDQLNDLVFAKRLPETELVWNGRFCTTAGRAYYHRDKQSSIVTKIELSSKVVDCEDRVRCVIAHEMCHLAVWTLDDDPTERGHGTKFKRWASRIENTRPDIVVNTTHSYEIRYKYKWECTQCGKIYGRHSKSINIEKNACGVCTPPGTLRALFEIPPRSKFGHKGQSELPTGPFSHCSENLATRADSNHLQEAETPSSDEEVETLLPKLINLSV